MSDFAKDYIDVATRIAEFKKLYPDGSLRADIVELIDTRVTVRAFAYRTPDDQRPGEGLAWEAIPGRTPYTRGAELMNAETSAWGRAIAALGIATKNGIATAEEVNAAKGEPTPHKPQAVSSSGRAAPAASVGVPAHAAPLDLEDDAQWAAVMATVPVVPADPAPTDEPYRHHGPRCPVHDRDWKDTARGPKCTKNDGTREEPVWCKWQPSRKWLAAQEVAR